MAWLKTLAETYDVCSGLAGIEKNGQPVLLPVSHSELNAQIEVTIDRDGCFLRAEKLEKGIDAVTMIPVTEASASRSSGIAPHPLCDKLCYLAGDYSTYTGEQKEPYHDAYMEQLRDWAQSCHTHPMVQAVYAYLGRNSLIHDLTASHILQTDDDGRLTDHIKIQGLGQTGANVRFIVRGAGHPQEVWKNQELRKKYILYDQHKCGDKNLCYATGNTVTCSEKHPSRIRNSADKAKLISGNDETGFTYRGRFTTKEQPVSVGYDTTQKAHNALRWLLRKQGYTRDGSAIVCWMVNRNMPLPDFTKDSINAYADIDDFDFDFDSDWPDITDARADNHDTGKYIADQFQRAVRGYAGRVSTDDRVAVIALDAATTGRLSVVYYDEMGAKQYIDAILYWQQHCRWRRTIRTGSSAENRKWRTLECAPAPRDMALAAYGTQRSEWLDADSRLIRSTIKRLLPCITGKGALIPGDIIRAAALRASMPQTMSEFVWYNDVLCVTCAMLRFNYEKGENNTMEQFLNDQTDNRDVLFGRLLAVYDYMEQRAMYETDENGKIKEKRTTNAKRYWNAFSSRPAKTAKTIHQNLISYERKLRDYELKKFENWTEEIMVRLGNNFDNTALSELYLPGYYQQMEYMKKAFQKKEQ